MQKITVFITMLVCCLLIHEIMQAQENQSVSVRITVGIKDKDLKSKMEYNSSTLLSNLNSAVQKNAKNVKLDNKIATPEAKKKIDALWEATKLFCTESEIITVCRTTASGELQIRKIPVKMRRAKDPDAEAELLSLNFNQEGQISDVSININIEMPEQYESAMNKEAETKTENNDINQTELETTKNDLAADRNGNDAAVNIDDKSQTPSESFAEENRIRDFIEKFRTAYNCRDIYYIENVYSNNALIISAKRKTMQQIPNTDQIVKSLNVDKYGYDFQVSTKEKYIKALRQVFKRNEFLNVKFDSVQVEKVAGYKIYGVSLYQRWNSTTYNDKGYLYLLIDCTKEDEMQVFIRAWAPEKVFGLYSFSEFITRKR